MVYIMLKLVHSWITLGTCFAGIFQYEVWAFLNGSLDLVRVRSCITCTQVDYLFRLKLMYSYVEHCWDPLCTTIKLQVKLTSTMQIFCQ